MTGLGLDQKLISHRFWTRFEELGIPNDLIQRRALSYKTRIVELHPQRQRLLLVILGDEWGF